jgi:hypothetical protein
LAVAANDLERVWRERDQRKQDLQSLCEHHGSLLISEMGRHISYANPLAVLFGRSTHANSMSSVVNSVHLQGFIAKKIYSRPLWTMPIGKFPHDLYAVDRVNVLKYIIVQLLYPFKGVQIRTWNARQGVDH